LAACKEAGVFARKSAEFATVLTLCRNAGRCDASRPMPCILGRETNDAISGEEQAVAIRSVAIPLVSGGAVLLGYAALSWLRSKRPAQESKAPTTLREAGLTTLELDLDFEAEERAAYAARRASGAASGLGARFLARATDALSPFGGAFEDSLDLVEGDDAVAESERRPSLARAGALK
jgi:hypothetical protein